MLKGFEEKTNSITQQEIELAHRLIEAFKKRTSSNPILAHEICTKVNSTMNIDFKLTEVRLRRIINYYRVNSILPVVSTKKGYYVSYDANEIRSCIDSLTQRINSMLECTYGLERIIKNEINGKLEKTN